MVGDQRELWLTLKGSDGSLVKTSWLRSRTDQGGELEPRRLALTARESVPGSTSPHATPRCTSPCAACGPSPTGRGTPRREIALTVRVNGPGWGTEQGYFGVGNQGWSVAGYRADGTPARGAR